MKLAHVIDRYQIEILIHKSKSHRAMQAQQLEYWKDKLGHLDIHKVTHTMIRDEIRILNSNYKNSTANRYIAAISSVFTASYVDWDYINNNPMSKVRRLPEPRNRTRYLSKDEISRLLEACRESSNKNLYPIVVLALSTGMRKMEILTLTWNQIDLDRKTIYLTETKNREPRAIPVSGLAFELIAGLPHTTKWVFPNKRGNQHKNINLPWYDALNRANITDFRFHDLRHTCASYLAMTGVPLLDIATILGHSSIQMTQRYAHLNTDHSRKVLDRLDKVMFG